MRAAPAFELDVTPGRAVRVVLALVAGACAAATSAWIWSHVDAAAGPAGHGTMAWLLAGAGAAVPGLWIGWILAPRAPGRLAWRQGQWTLCRPDPVPGSVQAKLDAGSWMLLCFRPAGDGPASWLGVSGAGAGPDWHALRATLFAPHAPEAARDAGEGPRG